MIGIGRRDSLPVVCLNCAFVLYGRLLRSRIAQVTRFQSIARLLFTVMKGEGFSCGSSSCLD